MTDRLQEYKTLCELPSTQTLEWHDPSVSQPDDGDYVLVAHLVPGSYYWPADSGLQDLPVLCWKRAIARRLNPGVEFFTDPDCLMIPWVTAWAYVKLPSRRTAE